MTITQMLLDHSQYINANTTKKQIVLHGTAGSFRPDYVVQGWASDPTRVGTHYVIGGKGSTDSSWDGKIIQAVPDDKAIFHLGVKGAVNTNNVLDKSSIGIELCNWGPLTKSTSGEYLTYVNKAVPLAQVSRLVLPYRGYSFYHAITDAQIESLRQLILSLCSKHNIVLEKGKKFGAIDFEFDPERASKQPITFHSAYREDKWDLPPQASLITMLDFLCS